MEIDQRNAGAASSGALNGYWLDRWYSYTSGGGVFTVQQSTTVPPGFINSVVLTVTTADASIAAGDYYAHTQMIEGVNLADLDWGKSTAKTITVSFWARSSVAGTYGVSVENSAGDRSYPAPYTISATNTWTYVTVTIPGDTTGTWLTTTGIGMYLKFDLGSGSTRQGTANAWNAGNIWTPTGSTQWIATNAATFYLTGMQLEIGSTATPFEKRHYGQELALCQRYYYQMTHPNYWFYPIGGGMSFRRVDYRWPVPMRAAPTVTGTRATVGTFSGSWTVAGATVISAEIYGDVTTDSGIYSYMMSIQASAEL